MNAEERRRWARRLRTVTFLRLTEAIEITGVKIQWTTWRPLGET